MNSQTWYKSKRVFLEKFHKHLTSTLNHQIETMLILHHISIPVPTSNKQQRQKIATLTKKSNCKEIELDSLGSGSNLWSFSPCSRSHRRARKRWAQNLDPTLFAIDGGPKSQTSPPQKAGILEREREREREREYYELQPLAIASASFSTTRDRASTTWSQGSCAREPTSL